jgi:hypothetical protein
VFIPQVFGAHEGRRVAIKVNAEDPTSFLSANLGARGRAPRALGGRIPASRVS